VGGSGESDARLVTEYVLKVASRCDLACDHCYVYDDPEQVWLRQPPRMELAVAQLAATRIAEHAARHGLARVAVILHGGEPLLLGEERLFPIVAALRSTIEPVAELDLRIQSNGTLLTAQLCEGLARYSVSIGISLDGDRLANDRHRRYAHGGSSHARVLRGIALLRTPKFRSAYGGILCTIDVANDPLRVYEALLQEAPPRIDFLLPHATWDRPPVGRGYAEWLLQIYSRWEADGRPVSIRLFESVHSLEHGGPSGTESLGVDNPTVAVIETNGTWELPDSLKTVSGDTPYTGLDLRQHSADDFARHVGALEHRIHETPTACTTCPIVETCGGGLYAHRFGRGNGFDNPSVYCADLARLLVGIRYRQRVAIAPLEATTSGATERNAAVTAPNSVRQLLENGADLTQPRVIDGLIRREYEADRELMFTVATLAGSSHGRAAWRLLVDVEAASPDMVISTLSHPYVRRRVRDALAVPRPAVTTVCHGLLASVAVATAVEAGHPATLVVPVVEGVLCLPGLGVLKVPEASNVQVSSSTRSGEFVVRPDGEEPAALTVSNAADNWTPVRTVDIGGPKLKFDDVDPARSCFAHPVADRLTPAERDARVAALEQAWSSVRSVAPQLAMTMDKMITTVTPSARRATRDPLLPEAMGEVFGAAEIPLADPQAIAVALVEHAARSIVAAAHRAFVLADAPKTAELTQDPGSALADVHALVASLRLTESRERHGEHVDDHWVAARRKHVHGRLDELRRDDWLTKLGRLLLNRLDDRIDSMRIVP
jgi:uncharacterized protein